MRLLFCLLNIAGKLKILFLSACILIYVASNSCKFPEKTKPIKVAVSNNTQFALAEVKNVFEKRTAVRLQLIIGTSKKLTSQIQNGSPYDIFLSANMKYPDKLFKAGLGVSQPKVYVNAA